jgi:hypothetical protein
MTICFIGISFLGAVALLLVAVIVRLESKLKDRRP